MIKIEDINEALKVAGVNPEQHDKVIEHLQNVEAENKADKEAHAAPKLKNEFGIILFDEKGELAGKEFYGHIYSVKQGYDHGAILHNISAAVRDSNELVKKKNAIINSIGEAFGHLKRKFSKQHDFQPKTKEIVRVTISNNKLV